MHANEGSLILGFPTTIKKGDPRRDHNRYQRVQQGHARESNPTLGMASELPALHGLIVVRDGDYPRFLEGDAGLTLGVIFRKKCQGCGTRFSLLPNDVAPLHSAPLTLICNRLRASLEGCSDRSEAFYQEQGLLPDDNNNGESWSDRLEDQCPSPRLFRCWRRKLGARAQAWMHRLLLACIFAGCDLKSRYAELVQVFAGCQDSLRPLALAAGLVALLQEKSAWDALPTTVLLLACSASHKPSLAAGRPPPHYGGDLELPTLPALQRQGGLPQ